MKNVLLIVAVVAIAAVAGSYFMNKSNESAVTENSVSQSSVSSVAPTVAPTAPSADIQIVDMEAGSFYYKPNVITVKKGQTVRIVFHSVSMMHNFNVDELNVHSEAVKNGDTASFEFTPDKAGTFEYYCSIGQHRKLGQVGKITIEE